MVDGIAKTPRYVLKDGLQPIGPRLALLNLVVQPTVVFGFSDKPAYDTFLTDSTQSLMPYPLIKGFLQNRIDLHRNSIILMVLDADAENQAVMAAASFQSVLDALQQNSSIVAVSHHVQLDQSTSEYHISAISELQQGGSLICDSGLRSAK